MNMTNENKNQAEPSFANRCLGSCKALLAEIEQARHMIVNELQETLDTHGNLFRLALNEAEALASQTAFPHLFFPALAHERVQAVVNWRQRQQAINQPRPALAFA